VSLCEKKHIDAAPIYGLLVGPNWDDLYPQILDHWGWFLGDTHEPDLARTKKIRPGQVRVSLLTPRYVSMVLGYWISSDFHIFILIMILFPIPIPRNEFPLHPVP
jgi:hypothetical protein